MKIPLSTCYIAPDLFALELHGKVYMDGKLVEADGRARALISKVQMLIVQDAIQAALDGWAPTPAKAAFNGKTPTGVVVDDINPEDLA